MKKYYFIPPMPATDEMIDVEAWFNDNDIEYFKINLKRTAEYAISSYDETEIKKYAELRQFGWFPWLALCTKDEYLLFQLTFAGIYIPY